MAFLAVIEDNSDVELPVETTALTDDRPRGQVFGLGSIFATFGCLAVLVLPG
jgi:hypothetical protein